MSDFFFTDFSNEIKELKKYKLLNEIQEIKKSETTSKSKQEEIEHWKNKYLSLLEKHNQLLLRLTQQKKTKSPK